MDLPVVRREAEALDDPGLPDVQTYGRSSGFRCIDSVAEFGKRRVAPERRRMGFQELSSLGIVLFDFVTDGGEVVALSLFRHDSKFFDETVLFGTVTLVLGGGTTGRFEMGRGETEFVGDSPNDDVGLPGMLEIEVALEVGGVVRSSSLHTVDTVLCWDGGGEGLDGRLNIVSGELGGVVVDGSTPSSALGPRHRLLEGRDTWEV